MFQIVVKRGIASQAWMWLLKGKNGKILSHSELYSSRNKAVKTAKKVCEGFRKGICGIEYEC